MKLTYMHSAALYYFGGGGGGGGGGKGAYSAYIKQLHVHPFYEEGNSHDVCDKKANSYLYSKA